MNRNNSLRYYSINKYIFYFIISLVAGVLITLLLYNFIGFDESNRILSRDMLIAIKKYNIDMKEYGRERLFIRSLELFCLILCINTKYRIIISKFIMMYLGVKVGLILTVFVLEMQFIGIINFILITFPQDFLYTYVILMLYEMFEEHKDRKVNNGRLKKLFKMICNYAYIYVIWIVAIAAEVVIKNFLIKKIFIVL